MGWVENEPPWFLFFFDPILAEAGWAGWAATWKPLAGSLPPHALAGEHHHHYPPHSPHYPGLLLVKNLF